MFQKTWLGIFLFRCFCAVCIAPDMGLMESTQENTKGWRRSQAEWLRQHSELRQNLQTEESLPQDFFSFEVIFQRLKEKSRNSCRELSRIFKHALASWIFPLLSPTFLLPCVFYIYALVFTTFCMEHQPMTLVCPLHSPRLHL